MDALLRYSLYQIAYGLLGLEIFLMLACCLAIIVTKLLTRWTRNRNARIEEGLSKLIEAYLFNSLPTETIQIPKGMRNFRNLVETLENYDHLFNDQRWIEIKERIVKTDLLPRTESYASSIFWSKRQLAARALLLCPKLANENLLEKLLDDPRYLVRVVAAVCITQISNQKLFYKVILKMSQETSLSQFPYRDALIQADQAKYAWVESLASSEKDKAVVAICLDILSTRYSGNLLPLIKSFVNDPDPQCRTFAIKALGNIPNNESIDLLIHRLVDSDWKIRAEAITSLQKLYALKSIDNLRFMLSDPVWWVRLQAALTLKAFGKEGLEVLTSQEKSEPRAYEIARYALAIP